MHYLFWLILSALSINSVHAYLLFSQKSDRKWSISEHATASAKFRIIYILGHAFGGAFFLLFACDYFLNVANKDGLFYLSCLIVLFEYVQAVLPAKDKTNIAHTVAAYIMWASFILLNGLAIIILQVSSISKFLASLTFLAVFLLFIYSHFKRSQLYKFQMLMVPLFFLSLVILVI
jgi:hypothetical protein